MHGNSVDRGSIIAIDTAILALMYLYPLSVSINTTYHDMINRLFIKTGLSSRELISIKYPTFDNPIGTLFAIMGVLLLLLYILCDLFASKANLSAIPSLHKHFASNRDRYKNTIFIAMLVIAIAFPIFNDMARRSWGDFSVAHDGGVLQIEAAMNMLLSGENPYTKDYFGTECEKYIYTPFWQKYGYYPCIYHIPYFPAAFIAPMPVYLVFKHILGFYDQRIFYLLAYVMLVLLTYRLVARDSTARALLSCISFMPFFYNSMISGRNDVLILAYLLGFIALIQKGRFVLAFILLALAVTTKQFLVVQAPFFIIYAARCNNTGAMDPAKAYLRLRGSLLAFIMVIACMVIPFAVWDGEAFWDDTIFSNIGLSSINIPLGGMPGYGLSNIPLLLGSVASRNQGFSLWYLHVLLWVPLGGFLLYLLYKNPSLSLMLFSVGVSTLVFFLFARAFNDNYLGLAVIFILLSLCLSDTKPARSDIARRLPSE